VLALLLAALLMIGVLSQPAAGAVGVLGASGAVQPALVPVEADACSGKPTAGEATCLAEVLPVTAVASAAGGHVPTLPAVASKNGRYTPADLASLYRIPANLRPTATIGIIDVGSDPNTEAQMSYYRSSFGLPACTTANGCFREVAGDGSSRLPATNSDWVTEIAIDVQAVSAICPTCHILLVDAPTAGVVDMAKAAQTATRLGANYVSLSYGSADSVASASLAGTYYADTDVTYVAAAGDSGYNGGALFPASAPNVVAAGGTSVKLVNGTWQQSAWSGSGSGCSVLAASTLQSDPVFRTACGGKRAVSDLSALADPGTGMLVYRGGSWWSVGGTSLAAPIITALYALAGNHTSPMSIYGARDELVDVTTGSSGTCHPTVLCSAGPGWDGPTGLGTPAGLQALGADAGYITSTSGRLTGGSGYPVKLRFSLAAAGTGTKLPHARVILQRRLADGSFAAVRTATTGADGSATFTDRPTGQAAYRVVFAGTVTQGSSTSNVVATGKLHASLRTTLARGELRATVRAPWGARVSAMPVRLERQRGRVWVETQTLRTNRNGVVVTRLRRAGTYRWSYGGNGWQVDHAPAVRVR